MLPETETETGTVGMAGTVGCTTLQTLHSNNLKQIYNTAALKNPNKHD